MLHALAILLLLVLLVYGGIRLYGMIKQDALRVAMDEIGRNLIHETQHLSRSEEARIALEVAGECLLKGGMVDGIRVAQKLKSGGK